MGGTRAWRAWVARGWRASSGGVHDRISLQISCCSLFRSNSSFPSNIAKITMPMHHRSTAGVTGLRRSVSGGMYTRVPHIVDLMSRRRPWFDSASSSVTVPSGAGGGGKAGEKGGKKGWESGGESG